jgi:hypothetical protein
LTAFALGLYLATQTTQAGGDEKYKNAVLKITDAVKKNDSSTATKLAESTAKDIEYLEDVMHFLKPRARGGFGVGDKSGEIFPDGIELKLIAMSRDAPSAAKLSKEAPAIEEMAYRVAAIGQVALASAPKSDAGAKKKADWIRWSNDMIAESHGLAKAAKSSSPAEVKTAAEKLNASCNNCHAVFR